MNKMAKCFSCKKVVERESNLCAGCQNVVCVKCALKYGHIVCGLHGQRPTPRAGDGATRATAKVKSEAKARVKPPRA